MPAEPPPSPRLHPNLALLYREKVRDLASALSAPDTRAEAAEILRELIERIDVISANGAPIYGSDAIAGTINVIMKKDFEGFEIDISSGVAEAESDAWDDDGDAKHVTIN